MSRRRFLHAAATSLTAPYVVPRTVLGSAAPSNRINVALIGVGNQSRVDLPGVLKFSDVQVLAVCDVNRGSHGYAKPEHFLGRVPARDKVNAYYADKKRSGSYNGCDMYTDFRDVLARQDIDAVMEAQKDLVEIAHTLRQIICVKG